MTDYNDGKWHGWNGGECPVHLKSRVDHAWNYESDSGSGLTLVKNTSAANVAFLGNQFGRVIAFRVIKEYREPREIWFDDDGRSWNTEQEAANFCRDGGKPARFREVLE